jgi:hypothetical protein
MMVLVDSWPVGVTVSSSWVVTFAFSFVAASWLAFEVGSCTGEATSVGLGASTGSRICDSRQLVSEQDLGAS